MAQTKPTTKVEMYDRAWGGFRSLPEMGSEHSGVFTSAAAANRYARKNLLDFAQRAVRITTEGKPSYVLRQRGSATAGSRIVRTTA